MAALRDEHGCPIVLTDEHGCPVQLSDEFGNPKQLLGVATPTPPTLASLLRADAALDSDPATAAITGGYEPADGGREQPEEERGGIKDKHNMESGNDNKGHSHEHEHVSFMEKIKQKLPGGHHV